MTSTLVLYIRHGSTPTTGAVLPGRAPNLHLSDVGKEQAEAVAAHINAGQQFFLSKKVSAVYASPMERAKETASPISKAVGLRVRTAEGLIECDFGKWTGKKLKDLFKLQDWRTVQSQPSQFRFPGGESFIEMQARVTSQVSDLVAKHRNETIICVSHADPIKAVLASALGTPLDLFQRIVVGPCSTSAVLYNENRPIVLTMNNNGPLSNLVAS
ncbi:MAG TPA: histidine phosphatase family protein [Acidimicrobiales bacterium]|nr:histidine phosphatase family protein [Acidimicrobiales bacterium]|tara:strand:- start:1109 stop:1750 length:642 start_codon:yes stop_codon:yes gene_type:complete